jgi:hypothetical protein
MDGSMLNPAAAAAAATAAIVQVAGLFGCMFADAYMAWCLLAASSSERPVAAATATSGELDRQHGWQHAQTKVQLTNPSINQLIINNQSMTCVSSKRGQPKKGLTLIPPEVGSQPASQKAVHPTSTTTACLALG